MRILKSKLRSWEYSIIIINYCIIIIIIINEHYNYIINAQYNSQACSQNCEKPLFNFVMSLCLSAWNNLAPTGQIFAKFDS